MSDRATIKSNFQQGDIPTEAQFADLIDSLALTTELTSIISDKTLVTAAVGDTVLVGDVSDSNNLKKVTVQTIIDLVAGSTGDVSTDSIFNAAGDLVQGTGDNASARLPIGTALQLLQVNAGATAVEYVATTGTGNVVRTTNSTLISDKTLVTAAAGDTVLIGDVSDSNNLKKVSVQTIVDLAVSGEGIDVTDYGAVGDGTTNDRAAIVLADAAAVAAGVLLRFPAGTFRVSTSLTISSPCKFDIGAIIKVSSGQVVTFTDMIIAQPKPIFDRSAGGTVLIYPMKQGVSYAEWWGAKTMADARLTSLDADTIDSAPAFNAMFTSFYGGSGVVKAIEVHLLGWYAVSSEIRITATSVKIIGKNPNYNGTGFHWIGTTVNTASILYLSGTDHATISNVGFKAPRTFNPDVRLLAAIRTAYTAEGGPHRGVNIDNIIIGDPIGYFIDTNCTQEFSAGILEGGPGFLNGNDDFYHISNIFIGWCKDGIRIDNNQAVEWLVDNYRCTYCDTMFNSYQGGNIKGNSWYAASQTYDSVFRMQSAGYFFGIDITGFGSEHLVASNFINCEGQLQASIEGNYINKTEYQRWANVQVAVPTAWVSGSGTYVRFDTVSNGGVNYVCILAVSGSSTAPGSDATHWLAAAASIATVTDPITTYRCHFFTDSMVGQKLKWETGANAGRTAIINTVLTPTLATVTLSTGTTAATGNVTYTNSDGVNEMRLVQCPTVARVDWTGLNFGVIASAGGVFQSDYLASDTRQTYNFGTFTGSNVINIAYYNCHNAFFAYIYDDGDGVSAHDKIVDFSWINCKDSTGTDETPALITTRYSHGVVDDQDFSHLEDLRSASTASTGVHDVISLGKKAGGLTNEIKTKTHRLVASAYHKIIVDGFFTTDKLYFGCPIMTRDTNSFGTSFVYAIKVGTIEHPELFGRAFWDGDPGEYLMRANGTYQMPVSFNDSTALQLTLIYVSTGLGYTVSQSGTTVTASVGVFASTDVGHEIKWLTGAQAGDVTYITAYSSETSVTVSDSKTRASGTFELEKSMTAAGTVLVQPLCISFIPSPSDMMLNRYSAITAETNGYNMIQHTEDFNHAYWAPSEITITNLGSGTYPTADSCIPSTNNVSHYVQIAVGGFLPSSPYTFSVYAKANGYNYMLLYAGDTTTGKFFTITSGAGALGTYFGVEPLASGIEDMTGGWYRCWITNLTNSSGVTIFGLYVCDSAGNYSFTGNGTSGVYWYGAQMTQGFGLQEYGTAYRASLPSTRLSSMTSKETLSNKTLTSPILQLAYVAKTAAYTLTVNDYHVNCTSNTFTITLETAVGCAGRTHVVVNSGTGVITLATTSSQTISGNASGAITLNQWDNYSLVSDGANWIII